MKLCMCIESLSDFSRLFSVSTHTDWPTVMDKMAKSATQEMATEIARISQTRIVEVKRVSFACGPVTLKMVKTTLGA